MIPAQAVQIRPAVIDQQRYQQRKYFQVLAYPACGGETRRQKPVSRRPIAMVAALARQRKVGNSGHADPRVDWIMIRSVQSGMLCCSVLRPFLSTRVYGIPVVPTEISPHPTPRLAGLHFSHASLNRAGAQTDTRAPDRRSWHVYCSKWKKQAVHDPAAWERAFDAAEIRAFAADSATKADTTPMPIHRCGRVSSDRLADSRQRLGPICLRV